MEINKHAKEIGNMLRNLREQLNLTQEQVAEKIGYTHSTVSKIENGKWNFTIEKLQEYCKAIGVELQLSKHLDFTPEFNIQANRVYHLGKPSFYLEFTKDLDGSYYSDVKGVEIYSDYEADILPKLIRLAADYFQKHLEQHTPTKK